LKFLQDSGRKMQDPQLVAGGAGRLPATAVEPKEIVTMLYKPDHRLFQLAFKAEMGSAPLATVCEALAGLGMRILNASVSSADGRMGSWDVFVDCPNYSVTAEAVWPRLKAHSKLKEVRLSGGEELVVEELFFPLRLSGLGSRVMIITQDSFQRMLTAMSQILGTGEGVIAYEEGEALGSIYAGELRALIKGDIRRFLGRLAKLYGATGVGRCEFVEMNFDLMHFVVQISDSIECQGKRTSRPNSQWIRGHLTGGAKVTLDAPMKCEETRCVAMGDPYCEFHLSKVEG
jgi:predicted hydrocarbon binding protein